jgi:hypothetical protein
MNIALKTGVMGLMPPPNSLQIGLSIHPSGKIEPSLMGDPNTPSDTILVTYDEFGAITQRLKDKLLNGAIIPTSEVEIPKLIRDFASSKK